MLGTKTVLCNTKYDQGQQINLSDAHDEAYAEVDEKWEKKIIINKEEAS